MYEQFIDFDRIFNLAQKHTEELMKLGFDISDPSCVTELEWVANKYPELTERCNDALLNLIQKQLVVTSADAGNKYSEHDLGDF